MLRFMLRAIWGLSLVMIISIPFFYVFLPKASYGIEGAVISFVSATLLVIITRIRYVAELSLGPLKAKMKEKIDEASATLEQLREISATYGNLAISTMMSTMFAGGMPCKKSIEYFDMISKSLKDIGVNGRQWNGYEENWKKWMSIIYVNRIIQSIKKYGYSDLIDKIRSEIDYLDTKAPSPQRVKEIVQNNIEEPEETLNIISDYEHYMKSGRINNTNIFQDIS